MRYLTFSSVEHSTYDICFLVPHLHRQDIQKCYIEPHLSGLEDRILAYDLHKGSKRTPVKEQREYLDDLLPTLHDLKVGYLVTCDAEYFKTLTKQSSADTSLGYVVDCVHPGFEDMKVLYCPNFRTIFYDPNKVKASIRVSLEALIAHGKGTYIDPGLDIIKFADYPQTVQDIESWLIKLMDMGSDLSSDIEGFSLKHWEAGIGTITFTWNKHEGISFPVDLLEDLGDQIHVRNLLRDFFEEFARQSKQDGRRMLWHNASYDLTVLIYQLFMKDLLDTSGLLHGLEVFLAGWEDTKLITYLATNSCAGNRLGLKAQSQEFAGNYAVEDIEDIRNIPLPELLQYNLVDGLSTWYVYEKHWNTMIADNQLQIYQELFKPAIWDIIQMQLTGLPLNMEETRKVQSELQSVSDDALNRMNHNLLVQAFLFEWRSGWIHKENERLKTKIRSMEDAEKKITFNPNSNPQLQSLLFEEDHLGLPVLDYTETKAPATGKDTLEKLKNHSTDPEILDFLDALIDYKTVDKLLTSFLPNFLSAPQGPDGWHYLFGSFNLGGTVSGRLSSSNPNLQNLPSKGKLAKMVKRCFQAPPGYLLIGLDFASLEDRISALTTKDPNKIRVYTDGFDGHCLRAYSYFGEHMPDIDPNSVESINSIKKKYPDERDSSKAPTFALTYQGTFHTLIKNCGFTENLARTIEERYHNLYQVSDAWVDEKLQEATRNGYVEVAFGLRLRTPLLHQVIRKTTKTPYEAEAEGRTAGNALGQSWCLLNTRASIEFMFKVRSSKYRLNIRPCAHIHDAQYYMIPEDLGVLLYVNEHLVKAVEWQDHPDIWHEEVKLGGELSIFYPNWACEMEIPNGASPEKIKELAEQHKEQYSSMFTQ